MNLNMKTVLLKQTFRPASRRIESRLYQTICEGLSGFARRERWRLKSGEGIVSNRLERAIMEEEEGGSID